MHSYFDLDRPVIIGHRGSAETHPENTLSSFAAALDAGAQILETDVHITRDGVPVLLHDPTVDRVTDGVGLAAELAWSEMEALDAGHQFANAKGEFPFRRLGIRVARVADAFAAFPDARFNLEIKSADPRASRATLDLIAEYERADRTLVTAGEDPVMKILRDTLASHGARPAVGACVGELLAVVRATLEGTEMPPGVMVLQVPAEFGGAPVATPELIKQAHAHGIELHVWTVNEVADIEALVALGVDGIVTDAPGRMAAWKRAQRASEAPAGAERGSGDEGRGGARG